MRKKEPAYPFQNLSLEDLPGECWEDIEGFDGEYQISSFGRVKSLRRWRNNGTNGGYYTTERIRRQSVRKSKNRLLGQYTYTIGVTFKRNGISISRSTARYVYATFIKPFDLNDWNQTISYKDGDGRNLHYENLFMTNRSGLNKRSRQLKRCRSWFEQYRLPIRQLTMDGKLIASYVSLQEAAERTGIYFTAIAACVDGRIHQSHGSRWESPLKEKVPVISPGNKKQPFNEYLWRKLGKPRTSRTNPIAAFDLRLKDRKGERWKPVEGLENSFLISNFGRVKSLPRFKEGKLTVWIKGEIKRLVPDGGPNKSPTSLLTSLTKNGKKFQRSVARLVYHHFVKKIDLDDRRIQIGYKNGKYYDLSPKNLFLSRVPGKASTAGR